jgi:hypothetical protein
MELSGQFHGLAALTLGKEPQVSVEQELGWAARACLEDLEKKNFLSLP